MEEDTWACNQSYKHPSPFKAYKSVAFCLTALFIIVFFTSTSRVRAQNYSQNSPWNGPASKSMTRTTLDLSQGSNTLTIQRWFQGYDNIRRQAQMNPLEREKADQMLSKGLSIMVPGEDKVEAQQILNKLISRYQIACEQLKHLPIVAQTEQLHRGFYRYYLEAGHLFSDYLKVQNNLFAKDELSGRPLAGQLLLRKDDLEMLDQQNKLVDSQLREQFNIPPYQY